MMGETVEVRWVDTNEIKPPNQHSVWVTVAPKSQEHGGAIIRAYWDGQFWRSLTYDDDEGEFYKIPSRMYPGMEVKAWASKIPPYREQEEECGRNND